MERTGYGRFGCAGIGSARGWSSLRAALAPVLCAAALAMVPDALAVSPRQLVEITDFSHPAVSPDGVHVAFRIMMASIDRNTYDSAWLVQRMDGATPPRRVGDGGVPLRDSAGIAESTTAVWSPDSRWIYYRASLDGRIDVWRATVDGAAAERLTADGADVRTFRLGAGGAVLEYSLGASREDVVAAEQGEYDRGIRLDRNSPLGQNLFRSGYTQGRLATQRLGLMFNRVDLMVAAPERWRALDLVSGRVKAMASSESSGMERSEASSLEGVVDDVWKLERDRASGRIALLTRTAAADNGARVGLAMLPSRNARHVIACAKEACIGQEISGIQWRPGSDEVLFTVTRSDQGFAQSIRRWNVDTGEVRSVVASVGLLAGEDRWAPGTCSVSHAALACVTAEAKQPPRLERIDLQTGARRILYDPNEALASDHVDIRAELLRWSDAEGRSFTGQLYSVRRAADKAAPLFVTYYRCMGFARGGPGDEWPLAAMAEEGIATLCINAPTFPSDADERYGLGLSAVESAIERLASEGLVDRSRVGMGGLSFGAEVTMWTLIHSDVIAAASLASPSTSQMYYLLGSNIGDPFLSLLRQNWQLGSPESTPVQWQKVSPVSHSGEIHAPILMQLPEQEYMHGLDYAIPLMHADKADVYVFAHEPHNKFQPRHKLAVYERNLDWFRFWLRGLADPQPGKVAQYRGWRLMRARQGGAPDAH